MKGRAIQSPFEQKRKGQPLQLDPWGGQVAAAKASLGLPKEDRCFLRESFYWNRTLRILADPAALCCLITRDGVTSSTANGIASPNLKPKATDIIWRDRIKLSAIARRPRAAGSEKGAHIIWNTAPRAVERPIKEGRRGKILARELRTRVKRTSGRLTQFVENKRNRVYASMILLRS